MRSRKRDPQRPLALIVIDIGRIQALQRHYGHLTGDQVLRLVGAAMRENVDGSATLARSAARNSGYPARREPGRGRRLRRDHPTERDGPGVAEALDRRVARPGDDLARGGAAAPGGSGPPPSSSGPDHCMYRAKRAGRNRTITDLDEGRPALDTPPERCRFSARPLARGRGARRRPRDGERQFRPRASSRPGSSKASAGARQ
jgi:diguanylate cyclase